MVRLLLSVHDVSLWPLRPCTATMLAAKIVSARTKSKAKYNSLDDWVISSNQFLQPKGLAPSLDSRALVIVDVLNRRWMIFVNEHRIMAERTGSFRPGVNLSFRTLSFAFIFGDRRDVGSCVNRNFVNGR